MKKYCWSQGLKAIAAFMLLLVSEKASAATNHISGYLYGSHRWVATNSYILDGFTYVMNNAVLTIDAGTVVQGSAGSGSSSTAANDFGNLYVCVGGKLNAIGTPTRPIIFTSTSDDVTDPGDLTFPSRGLWGGIVIFGAARLNNAGWTTNSVSYDIYEGLPDLAVTNTTVGSPYLGQVDYVHRFGGSNDEDSSGVMRYVSVRHGGKKLTTDKEINGWSMGGVGRGTTMEYLEAYCIADDGYEFFGGCVNTKHLVSAFNDDDGFDTDQGYNGKNQFWFGIQEAGAKDSGAEQNGQPQAPDAYVTNALPLANYIVQNATMIGSGAGTTGNDALRFRRGNKATWRNSVITDFGGVRVRIDDDGESTPTVVNNIFWGFSTNSNEDYGKTYVPADKNPVENPLIRSIGRTQNGRLDPRPMAGSPVFTGALNVESDGFWSPAPFKGAFDANDNWADGWTGLAAEGFFAAKGVTTNYVSGYLYGTHTWSATNVYILNGFTYIMSNAVVNIEAGTVVKGVSGSGTSSVSANDFGCLFVVAGGKLNARGTSGNPIIFTSVSDDVTDPSDLPFPTRGLWGGIVVFGNARLNNAGWTTNSVSYDIYEGLPDLAVTNTTFGSPYAGQVDYLHRFGGSNDEDSSGVMRYVSVRHGGKKLTTDKEINGWSMGGVGRGTTMEYLEAYCIADDGYEFFGGSVNTKYLVSAFNDDDGFDTDQGYNGKNQFWFGIQEPGAKDSGSEQNGQPQAPDAYVTNGLPLANYIVQNATLIGSGAGTTGNDALRFRRGNKATWRNSVITDFGGVRVRIDDDGESTPTVANNIFWGFSTNSNEDYGKTYVPADKNPVANPLLGGISRIQNGNLDPTLTAASPAWAFGATATDGFQAVAYAGAFGSENWAQDWTALGSEGFFKLTPVTDLPTGLTGQNQAPSFTLPVTRKSAGSSLAWTKLSNNHDSWNGISLSTNGSVVAVTSSSSLVVSRDGGLTSTIEVVPGTGSFRAVAVSASGSQILVARGNRLYIYRNGAWASSTSPSANWVSVASSATGTHLVAAVSNGQIYCSTDSGLTWTGYATVQDWQAVTSSADGTRLAAAAYNGAIYTTVDNGRNWIAQTVDGSANRTWSSIASSADGSKLAATETNGKLYTSTDGGVTWTARNSNRGWSSVSMSSDGKFLVAGVLGGALYYSEDSGVTWTAKDQERIWGGVAIAGDGSNAVATVNDGGLYRSIAYDTESTLAVLEDEVTTRPGFASNLSAGPASEVSQALSFVVTTSNPGLFASGPTISSTGTLTFTPTPEASGTAVVQVYLRDNGGSNYGGTDQSAVKVFTITVAPVNDVPAVNSQTVTIDEDVQKLLTLIGTDVEGAKLTYTVVRSPVKGSLSGTGTNLTYIPFANANGTDSFTYKANDGELDSALATVSITIAAVNDAPVVNALAVEAIEDTTKLITLAGTDVEGSGLSYTVVTGPINGTLTGTSPNLVYSPKPNVFGLDSFTYKANDGEADSAIVTVSITIAAVNDAPIAGRLTTVVAEDTAKAITLVGTDVEGSVLSYTVVTGPTNGTLSGTSPNLVYLPNPNVSGADSFTYKVNDGSVDSALATSSITIAAVNDSPVAQALTVEAIEDTTQVVTLSGTDVEGSVLTYTVVTGPTKGTLSGTPPNLVYLPNPNVSGADSFTYKANDGSADSAPATVSITIAAVNDSPVAFNVSVKTEQGSRTEFSLVGSDPDGSELTYALLTQPTKGTLSGNAPDLIYTPNSSASGADTFTYTVNDGTETSAEATVTIEIATIEVPILTLISSDGVTLSLEVRASEGAVVTVEGSTELGIWLATGSEVTGKGMSVPVPLSLKIDSNVEARFWRLNIR